jgi:methionyl-tRNA formyltransferase
MKIGILTKPFISGINYKVLNSIFEDGDFQISLTIIDNRPELSLKKKIVKNIRRGRGGYILVMFFKKIFSKKKNSYSIIDICQSKGIDTIETISLYSSETTTKIRSYDLDILVLINGFGIIKKEILNITPLGILSYHHGNMRIYRGMPPVFWELYNNEKEIGVTVQKLGSGLDSGIPIEEKTFIIDRNDTIKSLQERIYNESVDMMHKALIKVSNPEFKPVIIESFGKVYTLPNLRQWLILNIKLIVRRINNLHLKID